MQLGRQFALFPVAVECHGLGLGCLTPLSAIFQLYCGGQFNCWRKPEYPEKTTDLSQVTDKHNVVSSTPHLSWIQTANVSGDRH